MKLIILSWFYFCGPLLPVALAAPNARPVHFRITRLDRVLAFCDLFSLLFIQRHDLAKLNIAIPQLKKNLSYILDTNDQMHEKKPRRDIPNSNSMAKRCTWETLPFPDKKRIGPGAANY